MFTFRFSIAEVLTRSFTILGRNFVAFFLITALVYGLQWLLVYGATRLILSTESLRDFGGIFQVTGATVIIALLLMQLATAMVTYGVLQELRGRRVNAAQCVQAGLSRALPVFGVAVIAGFLIVLGFFALVIPGLILASGLYVAAPAAVVERLGVHGSLRRSWALTDGVRWRVFGLLVILWLIELVVNQVVVFVTGGLTGTAADVAFWFATAVTIVLTALKAVTAAVAYHDMRTEREGVSSGDLARVFD